MQREVHTHPGHTFPRHEARETEEPRAADDWVLLPPDADDETRAMLAATTDPDGYDEEDPLGVPPVRRDDPDAEADRQHRAEICAALEGLRANVGVPVRQLSTQEKDLRKNAHLLFYEAWMRNTCEALQSAPWTSQPVERERWIGDSIKTARTNLDAQYYYPGDDTTPVDSLDVQNVETLLRATHYLRRPVASFEGLRPAQDPKSPPGSKVSDTPKLGFDLDVVRRVYRGEDDLSHGDELDVTVAQSDHLGYYDGYIRCVQPKRAPGGAIKSLESPEFTVESVESSRSSHPTVHAAIGAPSPAAQEQRLREEREREDAYRQDKWGQRNTDDSQLFEKLFYGAHHMHDGQPARPLPGQHFSISNWKAKRDQIGLLRDRNAWDGDLAAYLNQLDWLTIEVDYKKHTTEVSIPDWNDSAGRVTFDDWSMRDGSGAGQRMRHLAHADDTTAAFSRLRSEDWQIMRTAILATIAANGRIHTGMEKELKAACHRGMCKDQTHAEGKILTPGGDLRPSPVYYYQCLETLVCAVAIRLHQAAEAYAEPRAAVYSQPYRPREVAPSLQTITGVQSMYDLYPPWVKQFVDCFVPTVVDQDGRLRYVNATEGSFAGCNNPLFFWDSPDWYAMLALLPQYNYIAAILKRSHIMRHWKETGRARYEAAAPQERRLIRARLDVQLQSAADASYHAKFINEAVGYMIQIDDILALIVPGRPARLSQDALIDMFRHGELGDVGPLGVGARLDDIVPAKMGIPCAPPEHPGGSSGELLAPNRVNPKFIRPSLLPRGLPPTAPRRWMDECNATANHRQPTTVYIASAALFKSFALGAYGYQLHESPLRYDNGSEEDQIPPGMFHSGAEMPMRPRPAGQAPLVAVVRPRGNFDTAMFPTEDASRREAAVHDTRTLWPRRWGDAAPGGGRQALLSHFGMHNAPPAPNVSSAGASSQRSRAGPGMAARVLSGRPFGVGPWTSQ